MGQKNRDIQSGRNKEREMYMYSKGRLVNIVGKGERCKGSGKGSERQAELDRDRDENAERDKQCGKDKVSDVKEETKHRNRERCTGKVHTKWDRQMIHRERDTQCGTEKERDAKGERHSKWDRQMREMQREKDTQSGTDK